MISTVTTSTVSTVTSAALAGSAALNVGIAPLLVAFAAVVISRLLAVAAALN